MHTPSSPIRETASPYSVLMAGDARSLEARNIEALTCIVYGRPFPEALRAPAYSCRTPATVEAGIRAILGGPTVA